MHQNVRQQKIKTGIKKWKSIFTSTCPNQNLHRNSGRPSQIKLTLSGWWSNWESRWDRGESMRQTLKIHMCFSIKGGVCIFPKHLRKPSRAQYQNKRVANRQWGVCLLMIRGESAHQCTWRTVAEPCNVRKIEMVDKKKLEEKVCGTKEGLHRVYTGCDSCHVAPVKVCLHRTRQLLCCAS